MLLAIDIGNTNTGFAIFAEKGDFKGSWRMHSDMTRTADEYASWLHTMLSLSEMTFKDVKSIIIASVVPDIRFNILTLCRKYFDIEPLFVTADLARNAGLEVKIDKPNEAGADRLINALAVKDKYGAPAILVDFGTATNFDVLDENGAFIGGIIAPGVNLSCDALYRASAKLPRIDIVAPEKTIGANTIDAMRSGIFLGYVSLIDGLVARVRSELSATPKVIATGGLANIFAESLESIDIVDHDITTYGLYLLHQKLKDA
jgi:type III pantothenate kinase